jgi:hypothetical protein
MTLTELLPSIQQLSAPEKLKLIRILAEDLDTRADVSPLEPFKTYDLPTPYNSFGAGQSLMQALPQEESTQPSANQSGSAFLLSIAGLGSSQEQDVSERDEEILRTEVDPIRGWHHSSDHPA